MTVTGFWHVGVPVSDMERSLRFYRDGLGLEVRSRSHTSDAAPEVWDAPAAAGGKVVFLGLPGGPDLVELVEFHDVDARDLAPRPWDLGSGHACLVTDDADAVLARMAELGFHARSERVVRPQAGPVAGGGVAYLVDPDGFHIEIVERSAA